jgi:hypothetical protein
VEVLSDTIEDIIDKTRKWIYEINKYLMYNEYDSDLVELETLLRKVSGKAHKIHKRLK